MYALYRFSGSNKGTGYYQRSMILSSINSLLTQPADFSGEQQVAIEPGCWFAAELPSHFGYALVSCAAYIGFPAAIKVLDIIKEA